MADFKFGDRNNVGSNATKMGEDAATVQQKILNEKLKRAEAEKQKEEAHKAEDKKKSDEFHKRIEEQKKREDARKEEAEKKAAELKKKKEEEEKKRKAQEALRLIASKKTALTNAKRKFDEKDGIRKRLESEYNAIQKQAEQKHVALAAAVTEASRLHGEFEAIDHEIRALESIASAH